jgi:hypothetical protein
MAISGAPSAICAFSGARPFDAAAMVDALALPGSKRPAPLAR